MRVRHRAGAAELVASHPNLVINDPVKWKGKWNELFGNTHPIHIEIGMGKGRFITGMAKKHPEINYIGVEMQVSVVSIALDKLIEKPLPNLKLLHVDGSALTEYFADSEIDQIYLNFSDPWPKKRHANRRLTSSIFLKIYDTLFKEEKRIIQKTDNIILFASSLSSLSTYGYTLERVSLNLHEESIENVMTEYEEKFSGQGYKINYLKAVKKD